MTLTESVNERLAKVVAQHTAAAKASAQSKPFGFYWTRKSPQLASALISEFTHENGVVLDPFMGSGSTAHGTVLAGGSRLFVGIELNEMPLANLKVTLFAGEAVTLAELQDIQQHLLNLSELYVFDVDGREFTVEKIVHAKQNGVLTPTRFEGKAGNLPLVVDSGDSRFAQVFSQYKGRIAGLRERPSEALEPNSRIALKEGMRVNDFFGPIAFECLSSLKDLAATNKTVSVVLGATLHLCRLTDEKSQSQFPYWHPSENIHEKSVTKAVLKKTLELRRLIESPDLFNRPEKYEQFSAWSANPRLGALLMQGDVREVLSPTVPTETVDFVLTDPPYFDQVAYSEYLKLWEFFTGFRADLDREIVESSRVGGGKSRERFLLDLGEAFTKVREALKPEAFAMVYFKDSKPSNLHDFIETLERAGLTYITQVHMPKPSYTYKQNASKENTVGGDALMIFQKSESAERAAIILEDLDGYFLDQFEAYIRKFGPSSLTEALDNELIRALYPTGYLRNIKSASHFTTLAKQRFDFDPDSRKWRLRK